VDERGCGMKTRITKMILCGDGPIFDESVTAIEIEDLSCGEYLTVSQDGNDDHRHEIKLDLDEVEPFIKLLRKMSREITKHERKEA